MQAENVLMTPWMKRMVAKYHDRSKIEKKRKAMGKQEKERQKLFAMKGKGQWEISKSVRGDVATPLGALRRKVRGPRGQPPGTITTDLKEVYEMIKKTYGAIHAGNAKEGNVKKMVDDNMEKYRKYIYKRNEDEMEDITAEGVLTSKGRFACHVTTVDELLATEVVFGGVLEGLGATQASVVLSCLVSGATSSQALLDVEARRSKGWFHDWADASRC